LELTELELIERESKSTERRIKDATFPVKKTLDSFDFKAIPSLNKSMVMELARSEYIKKLENVLAVGNSGTGKTHLAIALGLIACQEGIKVKFFTAASLVTALMEARDEKSLTKFKRQLSRKDLIIVDELGYVPFSKTGAELLFEFFAERYERGSIMVTTNLPFDQWTEVLGSERLTGALLDRLTHRVHILEMNGESYRFKESMRRHGKKIQSKSDQRKEENRE
jgi:DNA replication protein DnaC